MITLQVNHAEVKLWYCDAAFLYDSAWAADLRVLAQAFLREEAVVLLFKPVSLLTVLVRLLQ